MEEIHFSPGDVIYSNSDGGKNDRSLVYIYKGRV